MSFRDAGRFRISELAEICSAFPKAASRYACRRTPRRQAGWWHVRTSLCVLECGGWRGTGLTPLSRCDPLPYFRACRSLRVPSPKRRGATLAAALQDGKRVGEHVRTSLCVLECGGWRGTGLTPLSRCGSFSYFRACRNLQRLPQSGVALRLPPHSKTASGLVGLCADRIASWSAVAGGEQG